MGALQWCALGGLNTAASASTTSTSALVNNCCFRSCLSFCAQRHSPSETQQKSQQNRNTRARKKQYMEELKERVESLHAKRVRYLCTEPPREVEREIVGESDFSNTLNFAQQCAKRHTEKEISSTKRAYHGTVLPVL